MKHHQAFGGNERLVGRYDLREGQLLRIGQGPDVLVQVSKGRVWITEEGVFDDVFIGAGSWFRLLRPGTAVIEAMTRSEVLITAPRSGDAREIVKFPRPVPHTRIVSRWWRRVAVVARAFARRAWRAIQPRGPRLPLSSGHLTGPGAADGAGIALGAGIAGVAWATPAAIALTAI
jgi:hypothetical protein